MRLGWKRQSSGILGVVAPAGANPDVPVAVHGGPDNGRPIEFDFSTNANPLLAPPVVLQAVAKAQRHQYPDPSYTAVCTAWAAAADRGSDGAAMAVSRVLPTAGSSEAIRRLSLAAAQRGRRQVWVPEPGYGDYRAAAQALGLPVRGYASAQALLKGLRSDGATALVWLNEPNNPTGASWPAEDWQTVADLAQTQGAWLALDRAYEPLRLFGNDPVPALVAEQCWQLMTPNKALGLTGIRAGVLVAPRSAPAAVLGAVTALAPSWVMSAEGVSMLQAWLLPETQGWMVQARQQLRLWQVRQRLRLDELGWLQLDTVTPFWLARPPVPVADVPRRLELLRDAGIKLRDARSFGLPGWLRLSTQPPAAQDALFAAWAQVGGQRSHRQERPA